MKPVEWLGSSRETVRSFPVEARLEVGYQLYRVQHGFEPFDWKPMQTVGSGVREIRVRTQRAYRVIYVAKLKEAVYVLHAFLKKTSKTSQADIALARERFQRLMRRIRHGEKA